MKFVVTLYAVKKKSFFVDDAVGTLEGFCFDGLLSNSRLYAACMDVLLICYGELVPYLFMFSIVFIWGIKRLLETSSDSYEYHSVSHHYFSFLFLSFCFVFRFCRDENLFIGFIGFLLIFVDF